MVRKDTKPQTTAGAVSAMDLARLAAQPGSAQDIAKHLSAINAPTDAAQYLAVPHANLPKVNVNLPGIPQRVQASLPRPLPDAYTRRREQDNASEGQATRPEAAPGPDGVEITSPEALGRLIRSVRERRNLSQQSFADLAGVGRRFVSELENGKSTLELGKVLKVTGTAGISILARNR